MTAAATARSGRITGRIVLAILVGFFAAVLAVDVIMVVSALDTQPGLVADHAYERGLAHNAVLAEEARQDGLHWQVSVVRAGNALDLTVVDSAGRPVIADRVSMRLIRPTDAALDRALTPLPAGDGHWRAPVDAVAPGAWQLALTIGRGSDRFDTVERLVLP